MSAKPRVAVVGTFDTKGHELSFLSEVIRAYGVDVVTVDCGVVGQPSAEVDISAEEVAGAGGVSLAELRSSASRADAIAVMGKGAEAVLSQLARENTVHGMIGAGGSNGAALSAAASRAIPFGFPKVIVTTMASASAEALIKGTDVTLIYPLVDIEGLNVLSRTMLRQAGAAVAAMAQAATQAEASEKRPVVAATMSGVVTTCVNAVRTAMEANGHEVLVFHANGAGGRSYEQFIRSGRVDACMDLSLTELADQFGGGLFDAGDERLEAAAARAVPQVVCPGGADMVKFGGPSTVPDQFRDRVIVPYNENVTLMRANAEDSSRIGAAIGRKLRDSSRASVVFPHGGLSQLDTPGSDWYDADANEALFAAIASEIGADRIIESQHHVNDAEFAELLVRALTDLLESEDGQGARATAAGS
jgi:uncharacterized protein (UPF0261 family)